MEANGRSYSGCRSLLARWFIVLLWATAAPADDWPQFRGLNRDAVWNETGLLKSFPADGLKICWRQPIGWGWATPVVVQGRVILTDSQLVKPIAKERVLCFEEATGAPLWTYEYESAYPEFAYVPGQGNGPTATPIVDAGRVYAVGASGHVHCLNAQTGALTWEKDLAKIFQVGIMSTRPSPLIEGNLLILFTGAKPDACVLALDKETGNEIWKALDESVSNSSPVIIDASGKRQLIVWTGESVTSLNPATGETYWREPMVTSNNDAIPCPVFQKNRLMIGGLMMELGADQPSASILWPDTMAVGKRILSNTSTALLQGDFVYSAKSGGEFVCLEADTGKEVWQTNTVTDLKGGASIHITPAGDSVFLYTERGELILAQLTPQGYNEISRARLIEPTTPFAGRNCAWSPPSYANHRVYARSDVELVCASLASE